MPRCSVAGCDKRHGHKLPSSPRRRRVWIAAINRPELWEPGPGAIVCFDHFRTSDYLSTTRLDLPPAKRQLKPGSVPVVSLYEVDENVPPPKMKHTGDVNELPPCGDDVMFEVEIELEDKEMTDDTGKCSECDVAVTHHVDTGVQTDCNPRNQLFSVKSFDDAAIHFYTGLETHTKFQMVLHSLGEAAHHLIYYRGSKPRLSTEDQFLMTLIKFRTHPTNTELGLYFGIDVMQVSSIFITWVNFMYFQWKEINWWPSRELVRFYSPDDFRKSFPKTRLIIDGTECPISKPHQPVAQQATFSSYKNRNTMKVLVGVTPGGLVSYISEAFCGSTSDRQTIERSNIPKMCNPGDEIMADKGFNIDDLLLPYQVSLNIPTFFKKKNRMSCAAVMRDRKISSKRVHVERVIGLAKTYKMLRDPMQPCESSMATQIITVVFLLCNFRRCIMAV